MDREGARRMRGEKSKSSEATRFNKASPRIVLRVALGVATLVVVGAWLLHDSHHREPDTRQSAVPTEAAARRLLASEAERALAQHIPAPNPLSGEGLMRLAKAWRPNAGLPKLPGFRPSQAGAESLGKSPPPARTELTVGGPSPLSERAMRVVPPADSATEPTPLRPTTSPDQR